MDADHRFVASLEWTGNRGPGTSGYRTYGRDHVLRVDGKPALEGSAARVFHGDVDRWNPEESLIASLSACHMLSFLYAATAVGVVVTSYTDEATGVLATESDGAGRFREVVLHPRVGYREPPSDEDALHAEAHRLCFIANSVNFPVRIEPANNG